MYCLWLESDLFSLDHNCHICEKEGNTDIFIVDMNIRVLGKVPHLTALYHSNVVIAVLGFGIPVCWHRNSIIFGSVIPIFQFIHQQIYPPYLSLQPLFPPAFLPPSFIIRVFLAFLEHLSSASPPYLDPPSPFHPSTPQKTKLIVGMTGRALCIWWIPWC